jgi:hypothetical protein
MEPESGADVHDWDDELADEDDQPPTAGDRDDDAADAEAPSEDAAASGTATVYCPYCGEPVEVTLDAGGGTSQEYVEDCEVCCRPWYVTVVYDRSGHAEVNARREDD